MNATAARHEADSIVAGHPDRISGVIKPFARQSPDHPALVQGDVSGSYADLVRCEGEGVNEYVYMMLPPDNPQTFEAMVDVIGRPDLRSDDRFNTPPARAKSRPEATFALIQRLH